MKLKTILVVLVIGICAASMDSLAEMYDFEPGEPGAQSFAALVGGWCGLLGFPLMMIRYFLWVFSAQFFTRYPERTSRIIDEHRYSFIWVTDFLIVFAMAGLFIWMYRLWKQHNN